MYLGDKKQKELIEEQKLFIRRISDQRRSVRPDLVGSLAIAEAVGRFTLVMILDRKDG